MATLSLTCPMDSAKLTGVIFPILKGKFSKADLRMESMVLRQGQSTSETFL